MARPTIAVNNTSHAPSAIPAAISHGIASASSVATSTASTLARCTSTAAIHCRAVLVLRAVPGVGNHVERRTGDLVGQQIGRGPEPTSFSPTITVHGHTMSPRRSTVDGNSSTRTRTPRTRPGRSSNFHNTRSDTSAGALVAFANSSATARGPCWRTIFVDHVHEHGRDGARLGEGVHEDGAADASGIPRARTPRERRGRPSSDQQVETFDTQCVDDPFEIVDELIDRVRAASPVFVLSPWPRWSYTITGAGRRGDRSSRRNRAWRPCSHATAGTADHRFPSSYTIVMSPRSSVAIRPYLLIKSSYVASSCWRTTSCVVSTSLAASSSSPALPVTPASPIRVRAAHGTACR